MMPFVPPELIIGLPLSIAAHLLLNLKYRRAVNRWAKKNRFAIRWMEERTFFKGPFFWESAEDTNIYRIHVQDDTGATRQGFLKVRAAGVLKRTMIDVRWDE